ncbi:hypothetical protein ARSEF4850_000904 [Beauveria asiatica]
MTNKCAGCAESLMSRKRWFQKASQKALVADPYACKADYRTALSKGLRGGPESCIMLPVLALGQASLGEHIARLPRGRDPPGLSYFSAARSLLPGMLTRNSAAATQCQLLAAAYLFYLARPLEAWSLLGSASAKLQLLLMAPGGGGHQTELVRRIYRNTLLFESDLLAELDLPHSGAAQFEGHVGLPGGFAGGNARRGRARLPAHAVVRGPAGAAAVFLCARAAAAAAPGADRPEAALLRVQGHHLPPLHLLHF